MEKIKSFVNKKYAFYFLLILFVLQLFIYTPAVVSGDSMEPSLEDGDLILLNNFDDPNVGDIIVYKHPTKDIHIVHRIIRKNKQGYITKGDNNENIDYIVVKNKYILGTVSFSFDTPDIIKKLNPN